MVENLYLIGYSFGASLGFGIVFRLEKQFLWLAGLSGVVGRIGLIAMAPLSAHPFTSTCVAAFIAGLYAEIMAVWLKHPATLFLYPAVIPLIPGGFLCDGIVGIITENGTVFQENALGFLQACAGLGIGFAIVSMIMFYYRKFKALKARNDRKISIQTKQ